MNISSNTFEKYVQSIQSAYKSKIDYSSIMNLYHKSIGDINDDNIIAYINLLKHIDKLYTLIVNTHFISANNNIKKSILTITHPEFYQLNYPSNEILISQINAVNIIDIYAKQINDDISLILDGCNIFITDFNYTLGFIKSNHNYHVKDITEYRQTDIHTYDLQLHYSNDKLCIIEPSDLALFNSFYILNRLAKSKMKFATTWPFQRF